MNVGELCHLARRGVAGTSDGERVVAELARLKAEESGKRIGPDQLLQKIGEGAFAFWVHRSYACLAMNEVLRSLHALKCTFAAGRSNPRAALCRLAAILHYLIPDPSFAATLTVTDPGDSEPGTLRKVAAAVAGDTIVFGIPGPILRTSNQIVIDKDLAITGPAGGGYAKLTHIGGLSLDHSFYRVRLLP